MQNQKVETTKLKFNNTGYTITKAYRDSYGKITIETRPKTGSELIADWGF